MGARAPELAVVPPGALPYAANAAIVLTAFGPAVELAASSAGRAIPLAVELLQQQLPHPNASHDLVVRPVEGEWPVGEIEIRAASWQLSVTMGPRRAAPPPRCEAVSQPVMRWEPAVPMRTAQDYVAIDHAEVHAGHGPIVIATVTYLPPGWGAREIAIRTPVRIGVRGAIRLRPPLPRRVVRMSFTDLAGSETVVQN